MRVVGKMSKDIGMGVRKGTVVSFVCFCCFSGRGGGGGGGGGAGI